MYAPSLQRYVLVTTPVLFLSLTCLLPSYLILQKRTTEWFRSYESSDYNVSCKLQTTTHQNVLVVLMPLLLFSEGRPTSTDELDKLHSLFVSLSVAAYPKPTDLRIVLPRGQGNRRLCKLRSFAQKLASSWNHGAVEIKATAHGLYKPILEAWNPNPYSNDTCVIIDATYARKFHPNWYLSLVEQRLQHASVSDIAALSPFEHSKIDRKSQGKAYLFANAIYVPAIAPMNADKWNLFTNWLTIHRSEWFIWPSAVNPSDKNDPEWSSFSSNARAHWTAWYTRFLAENDLFVLYEYNAGSSAEVSTFTHTDHLTRISFDGAVESREQNGHASDEELNEIVELSRRGDGSIALTIVTRPFLEMAHSFICNARVGGFMPKTLIWITADQESYDALRKIKGTHAVRISNFHGGRDESGTSFTQPGYWLLMLERTRLVRDLVQRNVAVFLFDLDQVWLRDPMPYIHNLLGQGDDVDLVGTFDSRRFIAGNLLYTLPTHASKVLWREIARRFAKAYHGAHMHRNHRSSYNRTIENDQTILTHLVLYDFEFKIRSGLVFRALESTDFVDGRWYLLENDKAGSPVVINNNFIVGIPAKIWRARKFGHWFWDGRECNKTAVLSAILQNEHRAKRDSTNWVLYKHGDYQVGFDEIIDAIAKSFRKQIEVTKI